MITWAALWASKPFQYALLAVLVLGSIFAYREHQRAVGRQEGVSLESAAVATQQAARQSTDRDETATKLKDLGDQITRLTAQLEAQRTVSLALAAQRTEVARQVQGLTIDQVREELNRALGHDPKDQTQFTSQDQRSFLDCFKQKSACDQQVASLTAEVTGATTLAIKQEAAYDLLEGYTVRVERDYTDLYNDKTPAKRKWFCAWLCKRKDKINAPDPESLKLQHPKKENNNVVSH